METVSPEINSTTQQSSADTDALIAMAQELIAVQTNRPDFKTKLKSRKFWLSAAGCIAGIMGMIGCNDNAVAVAVFVVLEILSIAVYCISEGKLDNKRAEQLVDATIKLLEIIGGKRDAEDEADTAVKDNLDHIADPLAVTDGSGPVCADSPEPNEAEGLD